MNKRFTRQQYEKAIESLQDDLCSLAKKTTVLVPGDELVNKLTFSMLYIQYVNINNTF